jgi:hypothetical protein
MSDALPEVTLEELSFGELGSPVDISWDALTGGNSYQDITILATDFESDLDVQYPAGSFANGNLIYIKAVITDLAGNYTTGSVSTTSYNGGDTGIMVDQEAPSGTGMTTGSIVTSAPDNVNDVTIVSGYWNSHNTGLQLTAPLPSNDETLIGGAVLILGKKYGTTSWERLGYYPTDSEYDVSYNITEAVG